jgi:phosphoglycolate phosphatase-like HAD superfamily hydrolase
MEMKKTIFIDIDGTLIKHQGNLTNMFTKEIEVLPGVIEKLNEWDANGYKIILTTGRKEILRQITEKQLIENGIFFDQLIMGLPRGERILINDIKPGNNMSVAKAIEVKRDTGLEDIDI